MKTKTKFSVKFRSPGGAVLGTFNLTRAEITAVRNLAVERGIPMTFVPSGRAENRTPQETGKAVAS